VGAYDGGVDNQPQGERFLMASYGAGGMALGLVWLALGYALLSRRNKAAKHAGVE
jgi:hypothetical protein